MGYWGQETLGTWGWKLAAQGPVGACARGGTAVESVPTTQVGSLELLCGALLGKTSVSGQQSPACWHFSVDTSGAVRSLSTVIYSQWLLRNDIKAPHRLDGSHGFFNTPGSRRCRSNLPHLQKAGLKHSAWRSVCFHCSLSLASRGQDAESWSEIGGIREQS